MLAVRLHVGNKQLQGDVSKTLEVREENSFVDVRLTKEGINKCNNNELWKKGWVNVVEHKLNKRKIDAINDEQKVEIKIVNKLLMKHAVEHVEAMKGSEEELKKINKVKNYKRLIIPFQLVGSSSVLLTSCGRDINEVSSVICVPLENNYGNVEYKAEKFKKSCCKLWTKFIQWLMHNLVKTVKDFKVEFELK